MGRSLTQEQQERVWQLWAEGRSPRAIGREVGFWAQGVRNFVGRSGGVRPPERRRSGQCLSKGEREEISRGLARGEGFRAIGRAISRDHTTVSREVNRNGGPKRYRAQGAVEAAWGRARRPKPSRLHLNPELRAVVEEKLRVKWSPQQISRWLRRTYPDHDAMQVSHETIYLSLFVQGRGALRRELTRCLRSGRHTRHPRAQRPKRQGQGKIPGRVMISERPAEVEDRAVPGHWEGDLLLGRKPTGIATLVERSTRYCQLVALPDGQSAEAVRDALIKSIGQLPTQLRRSLTWDQGREMKDHLNFTVASGVQVYFCDPRSPWQRGSNENTNGLLRQYFPKRSDLGAVSQAELDRVAAELNGRPRQTLGWISPAERLAEVLGETTTQG
ncbi:MAG: IS30 family transposase [Acidimicrobiales bacterium]